MRLLTDNQKNVRLYIFNGLCFLILALVLNCLFFQNAGCEKTILSQNPAKTSTPEKILKGIHLLYDLEFDAAEAIFSGITRQSPELPQGHFYMAMVSWSRLVSGFWTAENIDTFKKRIDQAIQVAKTRVEGKTAGSIDYFYLGGALGFSGRFEMMQKKWFSAFLTSRKAIKALEMCREMDPSNFDALLGLGTYEYYTAKLSGVLRFLSFLLLQTPDKNEGLRKLNLAAEKGVYSRTEAKSVLLNICLFLESDCPRAYSLARELGKKYQKDPVYKHFEGVAAIKLGDKDAYEQTLVYMRNKRDTAISEQTRNKWARRILYLSSVHDLFHGRYPDAREKLQKVLDLSDPESDPLMAFWPLVKIGITFDLEGKKGPAKEYYRKVLKLKNAAGAQFLAERCLKNPPVEKDPVIGY